MIIDIPQPPLVIQTRAGRIIQNERGLRMTPQELLPYTRFQRDKFPEGLHLYIRKESTGMYNCHGMTFLSRRGFLGDEQSIEVILEDDEYHSVEPEKVCPGDIILYHPQNREIEHSGIVVAVPQDELIRKPWVLSKWGNGGEYVHRYDYCPYTWQNVRYMREGLND